MSERPKLGKSYTEIRLEQLTERVSRLRLSDPESQNLAQIVKDLIALIHDELSHPVMILHS